MSSFLDGIGKVIGKIAEQVQGRVERLKNEKERLLDERENIMDKPLTSSGAKRVIGIDIRLSEINKILANKAND
jgi:hypothetical protein